MLGQPISMLLPEVIGFRLTGGLSEGATATDLVLTIVEMLRKKGVVGKFVEFWSRASIICRWKTRRQLQIWHQNMAQHAGSSRSTKTRWLFESHRSRQSMPISWNNTPKPRACTARSGRGSAFTPPCRLTWVMCALSPGQTPARPRAA